MVSPPRGAYGSVSGHGGIATQAGTDSPPEARAWSSTGTRPTATCSDSCWWPRTAAWPGTRSAA